MRRFPCPVCWLPDKLENEVRPVRVKCDNWRLPIRMPDGTHSPQCLQCHFRTQITSERIRLPGQLAWQHRAPWASADFQPCLFVKAQCAVSGPCACLKNMGFEGGTGYCGASQHLNCTCKRGTEDSVPAAGGAAGGAAKRNVLSCAPSYAYVDVDNDVNIQQALTREEIKQLFSDSSDDDVAASDDVAAGAAPAAAPVAEVNPQAVPAVVESTAVESTSSSDDDVTAGAAPAAAPVAKVNPQAVPDDESSDDDWLK